MEIREVSDKDQWEGFFEAVEEKTFLQSWAWGEFHKSMGNRVWRMGVFEAGGLVGAALVVKVSAKRGTFLVVQHGPVIQIQNPKSKIQNDNAKWKIEVLQTLLAKLKEVAKGEGASFLRVAPLLERTGENEQMMRELGFRQAPMHANAYESTWKLDIAPSEDELLGAMRKTTRYLIRQTMKNSDIEIRQSAEEQDVEQFYHLSIAAGKRQKFTPFSKKDMESEVSVLGKENAVSLFFGTYRGKPVAGALVVFWEGIGFYHQAASLGEYAKYSVPYLVQWEAIKEAKRRGCKLYDFWGYVNPKEYPKHPWAGPTLFKIGFGGRAYEYVKTQDYPVSWRYWPIAAFETIRAKRRGL